MRLDALAEWIEGCVTFIDEEVSQSDAADILVENNIYQSQDAVKLKLGEAWRELRRRASCLGDSCPYAVTSMRLTRTKPWRRTPAYSFCLMLSLQVSYRNLFRERFGSDYTEQGLLFERLTAEVLEARGWSTFSTAWSKSSAGSFIDKVQGLASHLGELCCPPAFERWGDEHAKDGGLDVVCHLPFSDSMSGRPLLYVQCASGAGWKPKRTTPNLKLWGKLLDLATEPRRGIAIPFALLPDEFRKAANFDLLALLLDRHRLSSPVGRNAPRCPSKVLTADLIQWTAGRLQALKTEKVA